ETKIGLAWIQSHICPRPEALRQIDLRWIERIRVRRYLVRNGAQRERGILCSKRNRDDSVGENSDTPSKSADQLERQPPSLPGRAIVETIREGAVEKDLSTRSDELDRACIGQHGRKPRPNGVGELRHI